MSRAEWVKGNPDIYIHICVYTHIYIYVYIYKSGLPGTLTREPACLRRRRGLTRVQALSSVLFAGRLRRARGCHQGGPRRAQAGGAHAADVQDHPVLRGDAE